MRFPKNFRAKLGRNFVVPADTFDNVKGKFPIGFFIWHLDQIEEFTQTTTNIFDEKGEFLGTKTISIEQEAKSINDWIISTRNREGEMKIGYMSAKGNDFQNTSYNFIINDKEQLPHPRGTWVTDKNIKEIAIYYAARHCIAATWVNDRDQFTFPANEWACDEEFQTDCLVYTLFNNNIQSSFGPNHWIPFTEAEVDAKEKFDSHFMSDYISGKHRPISATTPDLFAQPEAAAPTAEPLTFSPEAQDVMDAGRELWRYYHAQPEANPNASYYDIRLHFQGTKVMKSGKVQMNTESTDQRYTEFVKTLRERLKTLAAKIEPKVYEYGFLKR